MSLNNPIHSFINHLYLFASMQSFRCNTLIRNLISSLWRFHGKINLIHRLNLLLKSCNDFCINGAAFCLLTFSRFTTTVVVVEDDEGRFADDADVDGELREGICLIVLVITVDEIARLFPPGNWWSTTLAWRAGVAFSSCLLIRFAIFSILWSRSRSQRRKSSRQSSPLSGRLPSKARWQCAFQGSSESGSSTSC